MIWGDSLYPEMDFDLQELRANRKHLKIETVDEYLARGGTIDRRRRSFEEMMAGHRFFCMRKRKEQEQETRRERIKL